LALPGLVQSRVLRSGGHPGWSDAMDASSAGVQGLAETDEDEEIDGDGPEQKRVHDKAAMLAVHLAGHRKAG
jgi:hypothetical protein